MLFWITFGQLAHTKCTNAQMHKSLFSCRCVYEKTCKMFANVESFNYFCSVKY